MTPNNKCLSSLLSQDMVGCSIDTMFIITSVTKGISAEGIEFARVTILDCTACLEVMVWDMEQLDVIATGTDCHAYRGLIEVGRHHDALSYTLRALSRTDEKVAGYLHTLY